MFRELLSLWSKADLLRQSYETAGKMLEITEEMYLEVLKQTVDQGTSEFDVHMRDKELNVMEREIRRKVLEHLSIQPKQDIVASLVLVSVVDDIERIGDYTKNIEELEELYPEDFSKLYQIEALTNSSEQVKTFFTLTKEAFQNADEQKAREVMVQHKAVSRACTAVIETSFASSAETKNEALASVLFSRYLKRISAHLKNIATSVTNPFDQIGYTNPPALSNE